jgi:hypothetical protein
MVPNSFHVRRTHVDRYLRHRLGMPIVLVQLLGKAFPREGRPKKFGLVKNDLIQIFENEDCDRVLD